jgi:hypothetical protein
MAKRCFVVQGFGKKTDYAQGKQFDLDASYEVIKEAVEDAGLECFRADELRGNALIDKVMYEQLLSADLVIADITTLNFNVAYELGVRFGLRPYATLVVGETGINFPFDVSHIYIHKYQHLGEDLGRREAQRFQDELTELVRNAVAEAKQDSPVYAFLPQLPENGFLSQTEPALVERRPVATEGSLREVVERAKAAMNDGRFDDAVNDWREARTMAGKDDYVVQQLALATYKSMRPDQATALHQAEETLEFLQPHRSFDPETLGLWAAVHKRLYELEGNAKSLDEAIFALERGFFVKQDYYTGINLAFMLDTKAATSLDELKHELRAVARYIRRKVIEICHRARQAEALSGDEEYWILATLFEASVGLGDTAEADRWQAESEKAASADWMNETTQKQVMNLRALLS